MKTLLLLFTAILVTRDVEAQEATSGLDLRATLTAAASASDSSIDGGFVARLYPTWKISRDWAVTGSFDAYSRPDIYDSYPASGRGLNGRLLQAALSWSRITADGSVVVRAGEISTAFGSFPLHYDEADNPLTGLPMQYGYYYVPVSLAAVTGVQVDVTHKKWDARSQLVNSSPVNPRSPFSKDQYGNVAGGIGYTVHQGFRVGLSGYRGPYLDRNSPYFFKGEAEPKLLPGRAVGLDVQWARGHWNVQGELQHFHFSYREIPAFREDTGYMEVKRVLNPRWFMAARSGFVRTQSTTVNVEVAAGLRPNSFQVIKLGFDAEHSEGALHPYSRMVAIQIVTSIHPLEWVRR